MAKKPVVIYGANGYTGRLIAEFMRHYQIPFIAAGRNAERVAEAIALVPGIETADYEVVQVDHTVDALTALFSGAELVCNTVGPFLYYGMDVVEACVKAKVHYLDSSGEANVIAQMKKQYGEAFAANGKVLAPSTAYMFTVLEIAARKVLETPGIDTLQGVCAPTLSPTYGSAQTMFSMFKHADEVVYLKNNQFVHWPAAEAYEVSLPGQAATILAHPWGGGTLPLYFENDPRVRNVSQLTGFVDRALMQAIVNMQQVYEQEIKGLPDQEQIDKLKELAEGVQDVMPPRENPLVHRNVDVVYGSGGTHTASCTINGLMPYQTTGMLQAATAHYLLGGHQKVSGFASACEAVGHDELFGQLQNFGLAEMVLN